MIEAARRVTGRAADPPKETEKKVVETEKVEKSSKKKNLSVSFDPNNLEGFNTEKKSIIKN